MTNDEITALFEETRKEMAPFEVPEEERHRAMDELEVGKWPDDKPDDFLQSSRKDFEALTAKRKPVLEQVKRARVQEQEFRDRESITGQIKEFGRNLFAPHELTTPSVMDLKTKPAATPSAVAPQQSVKPTTPAPVPRREEAEDETDFGLREDGTPKGKGFFGLLPSTDPKYQPGTVSSELSASEEIDGQEILFPLLAPGLSRQEIDHLLSGGKPTDAIYEKARTHALARIGKGQSPFASDDEQVHLPEPLSVPQSWTPGDFESFQRQEPQASPELFARGITQKMASAQPGVNPLDRYPSMEKPQPLSLGESFEQFGSQVLRSLGNTTALAMRSLGSIRYELDKATLPEESKDRTHQDYAMFAAGQRLHQLTEQMFPGRKDLQDNFLLTTLPQALGSSVLFYATGALGAAAKIGAGISAAIPGALVGGQSLYEKAIDLKVTPEMQRLGILIGSVAGLSEGLPIEALFRSLKAAGGGAFAQAMKVGTVSFISEFLQELFQQSTENATVKYVYGQAQDLWQGVVPGASAGGLVGFLTGAILARKSRYGSTLEKEQSASRAQTLTAPPMVEGAGPGPKTSGPVQHSPFTPEPKPKQPMTPDQFDIAPLPMKPAGQQMLIKKAPGDVVQPPMTPEAIAPIPQTSIAPQITQAVEYPQVPQDIAPDIAPEQPLPPASVPSMEPSLQQPAQAAPVTPEDLVPGAAPIQPQQAQQPIAEEQVLEIPEVTITPEPETETTVEDIHALAESKGIPWDDNESFMDLTERLIGKRHLDEMDPHELERLSDLMQREEFLLPPARQEAQQETPTPEQIQPPTPATVQTPGTRAKEVSRETAKVKGAEIQDYIESLPQDEAKRAYARALVEGLKTGQLPPEPGNLTASEIQAIQQDLIDVVAKGKVKPGVVPTPENLVDQAAHEAATSPTNQVPVPTDLQKEAGNYKKGHVSIAGLDISIENPQGSTRSGTDKSGKPWSITMKDHYGYIKGTKGKDKDHIDVFIEPGTPQDFDGPIYVVDQVDPSTGNFDEHKVVLGASTLEAAKQIYKRNYAPGWKGAGEISVVPNQDYFKRWLKDGNTTKPFADHYNAQAAATKPTPRDTPEAIEAKPDKARIIPTRGPGGSIEYVVQPLRPGATPETLTLPAKLPQKKEPSYTVTEAEIIPTRRPDGGVQYVAKKTKEETFPLDQVAEKPKQSGNPSLDAQRKVDAAQEVNRQGLPKKGGGMMHNPLKRAIGNQEPEMEHDLNVQYLAQNRSKDEKRNVWYDEVATEENVDIADLVTGQAIVDKEAIRAQITGAAENRKPPLVIRHDGALIVRDGNHRLVANMLMGDVSTKVRILDLDAMMKAKAVTPETLALPPKKSTITPEEALNVTSKDTTRVSPVKSEPTDLERVGAPSQRAPEGTPTEAVQPTEGAGEARSVLSKPGGRGAERPGLDGGGRSKPGHGEGVRDAEATPAGREPESVDTPQEEAEKVNPGVHDYRITDADELEAGGPKEKFKKNVAAIKVLKQLESEGRIATPDEQQILVKYVGWGGMPNAFYSAYGDWGKQYTELEALLTDEEWSAAKASTINAHYTDPHTITAIYDGIKRLGVKGGRLLEPGMGTGNFFGLIPSEMHFKKTGVELDSLTARIAKQLYQHAQVIHGGFEETALPDNFFDVTVGNVPFADVKPFDKYDPEIDKLKLSLHDYFFAKAMKKLRPGGVMAYLTSRYTMDKIDGKLRKWLAERADFLGAVRLPNTAFKGIANTEVVTDIIFLKKREPGAPAAGEPWMNSIDQTVSGSQIRVNEYYQAHPEQIMGKATTAGSMYRDKEYTVESDKRDMVAAMAKAMEILPKNVYKGRAPVTAVKSQALSDSFPAPGELKNHAITIKDNHPYQKQGDKLIALPGVSEGTLGRMRGLIGLREATQEVLRIQLDHDASTVEGKKKIEDSISGLNRIYDKFVKAHGAINDQGNRLAFREDPDYPLLQALEHYDRKTKKASKTDIFYKPTISKRQAPTSADNPKDALMIAVNESNTVDFERMRELTGQTPAQLEQALKGEIFKLPDGTFELTDAYLSGNVRQKLREAQAAAKLDEAFKENVEALEKVIPEDLPPSKIEVRIGAGWVPTDVYQGFIRELIKGDAKISYNATMAAYHIAWRRYPDPVANTNTYGTMRMPAMSIFEKMLQSQRPAVHDMTSDGKSVINEQETLAALTKAEEIGTAFNEWIWKDEERATRLSRIYNDSFNNIVVRKFDGKHLTLPGSSPLITLRPHQKDVIWRSIQTPTLYIAHVVGAGKTFAGAGIALEHRRLGLAKKPAFTVPNHLVAHWAEEIRRLYPAANVLMTTENDFKKENRRKLLSRIATGNWDAVVLAHSAFSRMPVSLELFERYMQKEIDALEQFRRDEADENGKGSKVIKEIEKAIKRLKTKLQRRIESQKKMSDETLFWEQLGIDHLVVDEADLFKNLFYPTRMTRVAGLPNSDSKRAFDMFMKTRHIYELNNGRGVTFMSGTPVSNTMAEAFTVQRYLMPDALEASGMAHFDAWARMFGREVVSVEMGPTGNYRTNTRFAQFVNVPELTAQLRSVMDVKTNEDLKLDIPPLKSGKPINVTAEAPPGLAEYVAGLVKRADAIKKKMVTPEEDNMLKIVNDGRLSALDLRLKVPGTKDFPGSKINVLVEGVSNIYKGVNKVKGTQLIFLDLSTPKAKDKEESEDAGSDQDEEVLTGEEQGTFSSVYQDIKNKLVKSGVKKEEIAFIHDAKTNIQKQAIFDKMNTGELRVLIGSTEKMGAGTNVQQRLVAVHHADCPWRPRDLEQRDGRIVRQGNMFYAARKLLEKGDEITPGIARHFTPAMLKNQEVLDYLKGFEVASYRYATKKPSFDIYNWQTVESKARMISQVMSGDASMRNMEDIDITVLSAAEMKALAADDPLTMEKISVEGQVRKLSLLSNSHQDGLYSMKLDLARIPMQIAAYEADTKRAEEFDKAVEPHPREPFTITIQGQEYTDRKVAGNALREIVKEMTPKADPVEIGHYRGLVLDMGALDLNYVTEKGEVETRREGKISARVSARSTWTANSTVRKDDLGAITSLSSAVEDKLHGAASERRKIEQLETKREELEKAIKKPFQYQEKLDAAQKRYKEILESLGKNESAGEAAAETEPTDIKKDDEGGGEEGILKSERGSFPANPFASTKPKFSKEARKYRAQRAAEEMIGFSSSDEEIEGRVRAAKQGVKPEGIWSRVKEHGDEVWAMVSREFQHLPDTAKFSQLRTDLLSLAKYKGIAADQTQRDLAAIIKPLSRKQYDQFEWKALLSDLAQEAKHDRALPFGYTKEKVEEDLDRLDQVIERDPMVQKAWAARQDLWEKRKLAYKAAMDTIGFDTSKKLTKDDYFRHQVLEHARERHLSGTGAKVRTPTGRGFLQTRRGSTMDINANYVQAEFEVMTQMVYDTQLAKVIAHVDRDLNIRPSLEQEAKARNADAIQRKIDEGGIPGAIIETTMKDFRRRIGMHMGMARKALELDKHERISLAELADIADDPDSPANASARGVFKAISERKQYIRDLLAHEFKTWDQLIPDTHDHWQPREGNVFYMADSIPAQLAKALQEGFMLEAGLDPAKLRKVLAQGGKREEYVIPVEAKATLDDLSQRPKNWFVDANRSLLSHWKQLMLIAPRRLLRYNIRNLSGDGDALFVGNPRSFLKLQRAAKELMPVFFKDTVLTGEAKEWANRGGYGTTLQWQELGDINDLKAFKATLDRASKGGVLSIPAKIWNGYWKSARLSTDYRESMMRYATYLDYLEQMEQAPNGRPKNFGASIPSTVMALPDLRDRAFKMSNELLGAYDRVSVAGQNLRQFWVPFWSWQEVNATRYYRLVRNAFDGQDAGSMARGAAIGTKKAASFLIKMSLFWSTLQAWNLTMHGDDEDELRETNPTVANRPHILFGRDDQGKIQYLAGIGALGDLLAWFGLDAAPGMVGDVMHDRLTIGEAIKNVAKAPVNRIVGGLTPTVKMTFELLTGLNLYPDPLRPRPIQDRRDHLAQQSTFGPDIQALRGKPGRPLYGGEDFTGLIIQRSDPKAGAYGTWQGIERKYLERMGKDSSAMFWRSPKGEALSNWSRSIKDQDVMAEAHWKGEYERLEREKYGSRFSQTKLMQDLEKSLRSKAPLAGVTKAERDKIVDGLDSQEKRVLQKAEAYYKDVILQVLPESRRRAFTSRLERQHWLTRPHDEPVAPHEF